MNTFSRSRMPMASLHFDLTLGVSGDNHFHIDMVYSTQSPSTINRELLAQTENFFVGHLSSQDEAQALGKVQVAFSGHEPDILRAKTPGYMRMLTQSHRFVIPVQARKFAAEG